MPAAFNRELTDRQRAVLDAIDRRLPLKGVAVELGISESRVNQHVRALKELFGVNSLPELVEAWRSEKSPAPSDVASDDTCRNPAWRIPQMARSADTSEDEIRVGPGEFVFSDTSLFAIEAPWREFETRVGPGALDGRNAVLLRLAVIVGLAFGILAAIVLMVTASLTLSEALDGEETTPAKSSIRLG